MVFPLLACGFALVYPFDETVLRIENLRITVLITAVAALIESPAEYYYCQALANGNLRARVVAEGVALFLKAISIYVAIAYFETQLLAYGIGNFVYSTVLIICYKL